MRATGTDRPAADPPPAGDSEEAGGQAPIELDDCDPVGDPFGDPEPGHPQAMPDEVEAGWERSDPTKGEAPSG